jgi:hypothetical protein
MDQRTQQAPLQMVRPLAAGDVLHFPAVLAVDADRHPGQRGGDLRFGRGDVAGVDDGRPQLPEDLVEVAIDRETVTGWLPHRTEDHALARDPTTEIRDLGQGDDGMVVTIGRQMVDEIDDAVL